MNFTGWIWWVIHRQVAWTWNQGRQQSHFLLILHSLSHVAQKREGKKTPTCRATSLSKKKTFSMGKKMSLILYDSWTIANFLVSDYQWRNKSLITSKIMDTWNSASFLPRTHSTQMLTTTAQTWSEEFIPWVSWVSIIRAIFLEPNQKMCIWVF